MEPRVALLGAGLAAAPHLRALRELDADVVTVASRDERNLARVATAFPDARPCWPPAAALRACPVDVALVLTPPSTHLDLVTVCAEQGVHAVVEKPLEVSYARALACRDVAAAARIGLAVCLQNRYAPAARRVDGLLAAGALGTLHAVTCSVPWWRAQRYYDEPGRGSLARDGGGVLLTQAVHTVDLMVHWAGRPVAVAARTATTPVHRMETEDLACAVMDFGDGRLGTLFATTAAYPGLARRVELMGSRGTAVLSGGDLRAELVDGPTVVVEGDEAADAAADPAALPWRHHLGLLADAFAAFTEKRRPPVSADSALSALAVIDAVHAAQASSGWVIVGGPDPREA